MHGIAKHRNTAQSVDEPFVTNGARARVTKAVVTSHEIFIAQAQGGGEQAAHIDLCALGEQHAIGVAKKHLSVGVELAVNLARVVTKNTV